MITFKGSYASCLLTIFLIIPFTGFSQTFLEDNFKTSPWASNISVLDFSNLDTCKMHLVKVNLKPKTEPPLGCYWYFGEQLTILNQSTSGLTIVKFDYHVSEQKHLLILSSPKHHESLTFEVGLVSTTNFALLMKD